MDDVLPMMATGLAPSLVRAGGFMPLNGVLKYARQDVPDAPTYRLLEDTIARASDEQVPSGHTQWRIWRQLLIRFRLFEVTDIKSWVALITRSDSRGIGPPPPDASTADIICRINGGGFGITSSGYVDLDLAGI